MASPALRLSLVTLGVDDVARAAQFYGALGMKRHMRNAEGVAFFDAGGAVLSLYGRDALAKDAGLEELPRGSGSAALAFNVESEKAVDEVLAAAAHADGKVLKPGYRVFWGGYIGYSPIRTAMSGRSPIIRSLLLMRVGRSCCRNEARPLRHTGLLRARR